MCGWVGFGGWGGVGGWVVVGGGQRDGSTFDRICENQQDFLVKAVEHPNGRYNDVLRSTLALFRWMLCASFPDSSSVVLKACLAHNLIAITAHGSFLFIRRWSLSFRFPTYTMISFEKVVGLIFSLNLCKYNSNLQVQRMKV